jgi:cell division protein FtsB
MTWSSPEFVLALIAITTLGWVLTSWIRARHGYPVTDDWGNTVTKEAGPEAHRQIEMLSAENGRLHGQIARLEERLQVLERIATDPAERTARDIDALRLTKN